MQVPLPCCKTCGKRISALHEPFRLLRLGNGGLKEIFWFLGLDSDALVNFERYSKRNLEILEIFQKMKISHLYDKYLDIQDEPPSAQELFEKMGIRRICCMRSIEYPAIVPLFSESKPVGSVIEIDTGLLSRRLWRAPGDNAYTIEQVYDRQPTLDAEEEITEEPKTKKPIEVPAKTKKPSSKTKKLVEEPTKTKKPVEVPAKTKKLVEEPAKTKKLVEKKVSGTSSPVRRTKIEQEIEDLDI